LKIRKTTMGRSTATASALWLALAAAPGGFAQQANHERGRALYENHCTVCHTSNVHIRSKRKARSTQDIHAWVVRWSTELKLGWSPEDVNDVRYYLNGRYYHY